MPTQNRLKISVSLLIVLSLAAGIFAMAADDKRNATRVERSGGGGRGTVARTTGSAAKTRPSGRTSSAGAAVGSREAVEHAGRTRVSGTATYGHYRGYRGRYHPYYWDRYYHIGWGWPYWDYYWHARPVVYVYTGHTESTALVEVDIKPGKASLTLNGEVIGRAKDYNGTWDYLWLEPGEYVMEFSKEGYQTFKTYLKAESGMRYRIAERMAKGEGLDPRSKEKPEPLSETTEQTVQREADLVRGLLHIEVEPPDAAIYLDGRFLANGTELRRLHGAIPLAVGAHLLEIVRPGYENVTLEIDVGPDEPETVEIRLQKE